MGTRNATHLPIFRWWPKLAATRDTHSARHRTGLNRILEYFVTLLPGEGVVASAYCVCLAGSSFQSTSVEGGATWRFVQAEPNSGASPPRSVGAYQDDVHWWFINARTLYRSSDAGQTWTKVSDQLPDWYFAPRVIDARHAWAQVQVFDGYGLATTSDAGLHWTRVTVPLVT